MAERLSIGTWTKRQTGGQSVILALLGWHRVPNLEKKLVENHRLTPSFPHTERWKRGCHRYNLITSRAVFDTVSSHIFITLA